jgi:hypothetical protein
LDALLLGLDGGARVNIHHIHVWASSSHSYLSWVAPSYPWVASFSSSDGRSGMLAMLVPLAYENVLELVHPPAKWN